MKDISDLPPSPFEVSSLISTLPTKPTSSNRFNNRPRPPDINPALSPSALASSSPRIFGRTDVVSPRALCRRASSCRRTFGSPPALIYIRKTNENYWKQKIYHLTAIPYTRNREVNPTAYVANQTAVMHPHTQI